ncbi:hypothetical protein ACRAKI_17945 [Saccharothrix isguenensis]
MKECLNISDDVKAEVRHSASDWCDSNLVPVVETKVEAFWDVCDATDEGFEEILGVMREMPGQWSQVGSGPPGRGRQCAMITEIVREERIERMRARFADRKPGPDRGQGRAVACGGRPVRRPQR